MLVYFAAPLFSRAEQEYNKFLTKELETRGFSVFLPQRDGVESDKPPYNTMTPDERRHAMFALDRDTIQKADIFLIILDGRVPDEGSCLELGMAYSQKHLLKQRKIIIGLQTDARAAFIGAKLNPIIKIPLDHLVSSQEELFTVLEKI